MAIRITDPNKWSG